MFVSKYGKRSGKSEDRSSKEKGMNPFRQIAIALVSKGIKMDIPCTEKEERES